MAKISFSEKLKNLLGGQIKYSIENGQLQELEI